MRNNHVILKLFITVVLSFWAILSLSYAASTTQQWREILNKLRNEWRTDADIKATMEDFWLDTSGYFPNWTTSSRTSSSSSSSTTISSSSKSSSKTTQQWRDILNQLRRDWRSDEDIKETMRDLWLDTSGYFPNSSSNSYNWDVASVYTSRSCKVYNIEYLDNLWVYTSPNLLKKEYFVNIDYFERYVDSKNPHMNNCPYNEWWINTFYEDNSNSSDRYTAPNWKVYFITNNNWVYTSSELSKSKSFWTINELKNYIRNRNPLIYMWSSTSSNTNSVYQMKSMISNW